MGPQIFFLGAGCLAEFSETKARSPDEPAGIGLLHVTSGALGHQILAQGHRHCTRVEVGGAGGKEGDGDKQAEACQSRGSWRSLL